MEKIFKKLNISVILAIAILTFLVPTITYAETTGLSIDNTITIIQSALEGKVAYLVGVGSMILATAGWAATENGSIARSGFKIAMALSIMFNAGTVATKLFTASKGLGL